jgi:hypothetical protein
MGLQVQRAELIDAEHHRGIGRAGLGQPVGDGVELEHPAGLGLIVRVGAGLDGLHRLNADVLVMQDQAQALVGDVVDHPSATRKSASFDRLQAENGRS